VTFSLNRISRLILLLLIAISSCGAFPCLYGSSCVTTANDTWDCGTPNPSDDLIVNHTVTISDNFDLTGSIIVNNGGHLTISGNVNATVSDITVNLGGTLTIDGNVIISSNCNFTIYGDVTFNNSFTIQNTAALIVSGTINIKGKVFVEQGASLIIQNNGTLTTDNDFVSNSNGVTIDGIVNVNGDFTNNKKITGIGQINYTNSCQGDGTINGYMSEEYCGTSPIELSILECSSTDTIDPEFTSFPSDQTIYVAQDGCDISVSWAPPTAADNCVVKSVNSTHNFGDLFPVGTTIITYTASDANANSISANFNIVVLDTISPVIENLPTDITQNTDAGACGAIVSWTAPTATDNCSAALSASHNPGDFFDVGTTTVTYTADDIHGNSTIQTFNVKIIDNIPPVIQSLPTDITQNTDAGACGAVVNWALPTAKDNCSATLVSSHNPGDFFNVGTTTVTYTAIDVYGNTVFQSFEITIVDKTGPEFTFCPTSFELRSIDTLINTSIITWEEPLALDYCSSVTTSSNYLSGSEFNFGKITITYIAKDQNGNESNCSFDITSGYNRHPIVNFSVRKATSGEPIDIIIDASDPDGDDLLIEEIQNNPKNSTISEVDYDRLEFVYTSLENFFGKDTVRVTITDNGYPSQSVVAEVVVDVERKALVEVSSAITTNGDMINDEWHLKNIDLFPENSVYIYDRWGGLIFKTHGYDNNSVVWIGNNNQSNLGNQNFVSTGTYFYIIDLGNGNGKLTGAVEVIE